MELKRMVGLISSAAGGCQYCVAHNAHGLGLEGVTAERQAAIWEFDSSPLFTAAERAALRVARGGSQVPNAVTDAEVQQLKAHFSPRQIAEIVAVIALFGFLNRWNSTLQVRLECGNETPLLCGSAQVHSQADGDLLTVPLPGAVWVFGSALGVMGWMRRRSHA